MEPEYDCICYNLGANDENGEHENIEFKVSQDITIRELLMKIKEIKTKYPGGDKIRISVPECFDSNRDYQNIHFRRDNKLFS
jgi:hypothetical protein